MERKLAKVEPKRSDRTIPDAAGSNERASSSGRRRGATTGAGRRREHGRNRLHLPDAPGAPALTLLGQMLELKARGKTSAAIKALLGVAPETATDGRGAARAKELPE